VSRWRAPVVAGARCMMETLASLVSDCCLACSLELAPHRGRAIDEPRGVCAACALTIVPLGSPFCLEEHEGESRWRCRAETHVHLLAAAQYGGAIADVVRATKFRDAPSRLAIWEDVWRAARETAAAVRPPCDVLVPIPAHRARVRERGFDVTASWAARLSRVEGVPAVAALSRVRATPPQVGLDRMRRARNVDDAFAPSALSQTLRGRHVALVDDVVTTGATVRAAASVVRACGARSVAAWALAYEPLE
jgi:ComF family protein